MLNQFGKLVLKGTLLLANKFLARFIVEKTLSITYCNSTVEITYTLIFNTGFLLGNHKIVLQAKWLFPI